MFSEFSLEKTNDSDGPELRLPTSQLSGGTAAPWTSFDQRGLVDLLSSDLVYMGFIWGLKGGLNMGFIYGVKKMVKGGMLRKKTAWKLLVVVVFMSLFNVSSLPLMFYVVGVLGLFYP